MILTRNSLKLKINFIESLSRILIEPSKYFNFMLNNITYNDFFKHF